MKPESYYSAFQDATQLIASDRSFVVNAIKDALMELEELEEVSQGVVDKLISSLEILGESYE